MKLRKHGVSRYRAGGKLGPACWKIHDLIVVMEGSLAFSHPGGELEIKTKDALIIGPNTKFQALTGKQGGLIWVGHFTFSRHEDTDWLPPPGQVALHPGGCDSAWGESLLNRIYETYPTGGAKDECHLLLSLLLDEIHRRSQLAIHSPIREALRIAEEQQWIGVTPARLAMWANYSESHFRALFQREQGVAVGTYIRTKRLALARQLLKDPQIPLKEISERIGYSDPAAFHHAFTAAQGCTPGAYRKQTVARH